MKQLYLGLTNELIVDNFAGGGGASLGIELAVKRPVDIAVNHDSEAVAMHVANHPQTRHYCENVWNVDPMKATSGKPVGLAWFSPDCFPAGTMVLTREGYRPIEEIEVGDEVLTHTRQWRPVSAKMRAVRPLVRLRGQGHPGLLVSPEHPFYARRRCDVWRVASEKRPRGYERTLEPPAWVRAGDLDHDWYWASPAEFPASEVPSVPVYRQRETTVSADLLWLAGRYVADGWTRLTDTRAELVITCGWHEIAGLRERLHFWKREGLRSGSDEMAWHERETATAYQFAASHRGFVEWLREHFGHGAAEKKVPGWALGMERGLREALLAGYLSGDGCVHHGDGTPITIATTVSKALAFGLRALAGSLGHSPTVALRVDQPDTIEGRKVNVRPAWSVRWRADITEGHAQSFRDDGLIWTAIRERVDGVSDAAEVFNLSVEHDESYIADGIVVHNCTYHSKARGGKPFRDRKQAKRKRGLAWIVIKWAKLVQPRVIMLENVEEFQNWGPLLEDGTPCPIRKGLTFRRWKKQLENLGYKVECRELRACDYGAPTIRKRLFVIARRDGLPIVWPEPSHGKGLKPYRTAAECIDWSLTCPSIFERKKPLAEATMRRIAKGIFRYVINAKEPFIVTCNHGKPGFRGQGIHEPMKTITASRDAHGLVMPYVLTNTTGHPGAPSEEPLRTVTTGGHHALVSAFLAQHNTGMTGHDARKPLSTITSRGTQQQVVAAHMINLKGSDRRMSAADDPAPTVTAGGYHIGEVRAFLVKYYGTDQDPKLREPMHTVTTKPRFGLVTVHGEDYIIADIGMRMLQPRELYRAQGFPDTYQIDATVNGKPLTKTAQVRMCGNSVSPIVATALVMANFQHEYANACEEGAA